MPLPTPLFCNTSVSKTQAIAFLEAMICEFNSLTRLDNSKKFAELGRDNFEQYKIQHQAIFQRRDDLTDSIVLFARMIGAYVDVHRQRLKLVVPD